MRSIGIALLLFVSILVTACANLPKLGVGLCDGAADCPDEAQPDLRSSDLAVMPSPPPDLSCPAESCFSNQNVVQAIFYVRDANGQCVRMADQCRFGWDCKIEAGNAVCFDTRSLDMGLNFAKCASVVSQLDDCFKRFRDPAARQNCYAPLVAMTEGGAQGKAGSFAACVNTFCGDRTLPTGACTDRACNGLNPATSCCLALAACVADR